MGKTALGFVIGIVVEWERVREGDVDGFCRLLLYLYIGVKYYVGVTS